MCLTLGVSKWSVIVAFAAEYFVVYCFKCNIFNTVSQSQLCQAWMLDWHCAISARNNRSALLVKALPTALNVMTESICSRENSHTSSPAQPQSPTQSQNQRQFQHVKASKSMDLGTTQNQQHTGGEIFLFICSAWWLHASFPHRNLSIPADAWLLHRQHAPPSHMQTDTSADMHCTLYNHTHTHSCMCRWGTI